jgi:hypothetical protein
MRLAYVDEAGIGNPAHEPYLVVAGVIIHGNGQLAQVRSQLGKIVRKWIPPEKQDGFVFHATELFNGGGKVFVRDKPGCVDPQWPLSKRLKIAAELAKVFKANKLPIVFKSIERATFPKTAPARVGWDQLSKQRKVINAHVVAHVVATMKIDLWLRANTQNEHCMMVVEDNEQAREFIHQMHQHNQDRKLEMLEPKERQFFPLKKIVEDPLFQAKRPTSPLQLADFCAYVVKKRLMGDARYDEVFDLLAGQIVEPSPRPLRKK